MLKAVYLDDKEHEYLIKFINEYKDENNKPNISSAIRFLMQKGYESIYRKKVVDIPYNKSKINKEEIKKEVVSEVMSELNSQVLTNLTSAINKLSNINTISMPTTVEQKQEQKPVVPKKKKVVIPADGNELLANLLGNANR